MRWAVVALAAAAAPESNATVPARLQQSQPAAGCASPFHTAAPVLFPPIPTVLPSEGYCKQFYGQDACCLPAYTLAVAAQVEGAMERTESWPKNRKLCVDRMLEFYVGAACTLCDPGWARYSSQNEDGEWIVAVQEENCHYLWAACSTVLEGKFTAPQFCTALMTLHDGAVEQILAHTAPTSTTTTTSTTEPPVVATVRHSKQRLRRHAEKPPTVVVRSLGLVTRSWYLRTSAPLEAEPVNHTKPAGNATAAADGSDAADDTDDDDDDSDDDDDADEGESPTLQPGTAVVHAKEPGAPTESSAVVVNVSAPVISPERTERAAEAAGSPCKLPFPPLVFSPLPQALSAVDEGQFGGFERGGAALLALSALLLAA